MCIAHVCICVCVSGGIVYCVPFYRLNQRFSKCGEPRGGGGAQVDCMRNIFISNEILVQGKIHILIGTLLS
jgi:hypothetical protein